MVALFERRKNMAKKSRYLAYAKGMQALKEKDNGIIFSDNTLKNEASIMKRLSQMKEESKKQITKKEET